MKRTKTVSALILIIALAFQVVMGQRLNSQSAWPGPIPARIHDGANLDLTVMTLGDVETSLADGVFDPSRDQVRSRDGTVKSNYYKDTLGIKFFSPLDKSNFPLPPSGWCSWYFYFQEINEDEIRNNARWISTNLKDYGARYVQIDDGWQGTGHGLGENRDWTTIDKRFSGGMDKLAFDIKQMGLVPGIWLAPHGQSNEAVIRNHPAVFLKKPDGSSAADTWEGKFLVDPSTVETQKYLADLFTKLSRWGYEYFKIDGQPIVIREFKAKKEFMKNPGAEPDELYRQTLNTIRNSIGPHRYLLGCWVVPLEGAGIMNGSRTGADVVLGWDGFKYAMRATMQYYFLHNIAWYNDPDVLVVRAPLPIEQARAWTTLIGLTGQALLTSDRLMDLSPDRVELLRRVYPAVDIRPLDLFPSERNKHIWDLKVNHLGRAYDVVGLFNYDDLKTAPIYVSWKDLALPAGKRIHVFDYWNHEYLGLWEQGMSIELAPASCRLLTLLSEENHPQLISTSRHLTQGWVDLVSQKYDAKTNAYQGRSKVIKNDPYEVRFVFPSKKNFTIKRAVANGPKGSLPVTISNHQGWATIQFTSLTSSEVSWKVEFEPAGSYHFPTREPGGLWVESAGPDAVNLRWSAGPQPASGYEVSLNGKVVGVTPANVFALRRLDSRASYTAEVRTVGQDGTTSEQKATINFIPHQVAPAETPLTELEVFTITPGWRQPELNRTYTGKGLFVGGKHFASGIGMPTKSEIEFQLQQAYETFSAAVGIDDQQGNDGGVEFTVLGDGRELWTSGVIKKSDGVKPLKLSVRGVRRLQLAVKNAASVTGRVHADWLDARLSK
jgi:NPCBM/NEW2 domain/Melibiase/Alpha galactosidase C-terminal beta sandwich domain